MVLRLVEAKRKDGNVRIEVRDVGPGIPEDEQEAALGRFRRIGEHTVPGTGLGNGTIEGGYIKIRVLEGPQRDRGAFQVSA